MTNPATEIVYVWAAYAATVLIVSAVTAWTLLAAREQKRQLAALEAKGVRRRSAGNL